MSLEIFELYKFKLKKNKIHPCPHSIAMPHKFELSIIYSSGYIEKKDSFFYLIY
jgi:hypothetical protein